MIDDKIRDLKNTPSLTVLPQAMALWIGSDIGYYILFSGGYNVTPIQIAIYYLFWLGLTIFSFRDVYREWRVLDNKFWASMILLVGSVGVALYLVFVLPNFPGISWSKSWQPPSELLFATPWYFLPKSMEIMLQQLLVAAIVLTLAFYEFNLKEISRWCALIFGGAHLLLVFGGGNWIYVSTFTISAVIASFIFPYLILKAKNGFIYSYFLHWLFYAIIIVLIRI